MYDPAFDLRRLEVILSEPVAIESITHFTRMSDFFKYYLTRFITNLTHSFKDFTHSEIEGYNSRFKSSIDSALSDPTLELTNVMFPIPKGMNNSYAQTLHAFVDILNGLGASYLIDTLRFVKDSLQSGSLVSPRNTEKYSKSQFELDKKSIGHLFSKVGLTHSTFEFSLVDMTSVIESNQNLLNITKEYYPVILEIVKMFKTIEHFHSTTSLSSADKEILSNRLIIVAYRLSIFAMVMEHVQDIEHNFVQCLDILRKLSHRK